MEIRTRPAPPQDAAGLAQSASTVPTLSIALTIPLPVTWPRRLQGIEARLPEEVAVTCIEFAFGGSGERPAPARTGRRFVRRRSSPGPAACLAPPVLVQVPPSFATAMREGAWWQLALARLGQRTRRLQIFRLLPL